MTIQTLKLNSSSFKAKYAEEHIWLETISEYINRFIEQTFKDSIPHIEVKNNKSLKRASARFTYMRDPANRNFMIEVSNRLLVSACRFRENEDVLDGIESILRHEAIHYGLFYLGHKDYRDGDPLFEKAISIVGGTPSDSTNKQLVYKGSRPIARFGFIYKCPSCKTEAMATHKLFYKCKNCKVNVDYLSVGLTLTKDENYGAKELDSNLPYILNSTKPQFTLASSYYATLLKYANRSLV